MPKKPVERFVLTLPLIVTPFAKRQLDTRFKVAAAFYNAALGEAVRRWRRHRRSAKFKESMELYREYHEVKNIKAEKQRAAELRRKAASLYEEAATEVGYYAGSTDKKPGRNKDHPNFTMDLVKYCAENFRKGTFIEYHLDARICNLLTETAFSATERLVPRSLKNVPAGKARSVRFKGHLNPVTSLTDRNGNTLRWVDDKVIWGGEGRERKGLGPQLILPAMIDRSDPKVNHALSREVKYVELVRKKIHADWRYYAHLVCEGKPLPKESHTLGKGAVGVDIGPSTVAYVTREEAGIELLFQEVSDREHADIQRQVRIFSRALDRSRRSMNPENYNNDGTVKPRNERVRWKYSHRYQQTQAKKADLERKLREHRKCMARQLAWYLRGLGDELYLEKLQYKTWQKPRKAKVQSKKSRRKHGTKIGTMGFSNSVQRRAPGMFVTILKDVFSSTGGQVFEINTRTSKLTKTCPSCLKLRSVRLKDKVYECECGYVAHRDLKAAMLATCVDPTSQTVHADRARVACRERGPLLRAACKRLLELARDGHLPGSFGTVPELERVARVGSELPAQSPVAHDGEQAAQPCQPPQFERSGDEKTPGTSRQP